MKVFILLWLYFVRPSLAILQEPFYLQGVSNGLWNAARMNCPKQMVTINETQLLSNSANLKDCLGNVSRAYVGNVRIISRPLKLIGCYMMTDTYQNLMNNSIDMKFASVAFCNYLCPHSNGQFAIHERRCKCFIGNNYDLPSKKTNHLKNASLCSVCEDNKEDICGVENAAAFYQDSHIMFFPSNQEAICIDNNRRNALCSERIDGICENGMPVYNKTWTTKSLYCAHANGSFLADDNHIPRVMINSRRYSIDVPESLLSHEFKVTGSNSSTKNAWYLTYFGFLWMNYSTLHLSYGFGDTERQRSYFSLCKTSSMGNPDVKTEKTCGETPMSSMLTIHHSNHITSGTITPRTSTVIKQTNLPNSNSSSREYVSSKSTDGVYSSNTFTSRHKTGSKDSSGVINLTTSNIKTDEETDDTMTGLIVPVVIGVLSIFMIAVIASILYCRRIASKKQSENSHDGPKPLFAQTDGGSKIELEVNVAVHASNTPVYAVVSKPTRPKASQNNEPGNESVKNITKQSEDEFYVSNDEDYDQLRAKRKPMHSNLCESDYNVAEPGTFDNNIYSLAKPMDENEQKDGTYDVAMSVINESEGSTVHNDTYDHSSPL